MLGIRTSGLRHTRHSHRLSEVLCSQLRRSPHAQVRMWHQILQWWLGLEQYWGHSDNSWNIFWDKQIYIIVSTYKTCKVTVTSLNAWKTLIQTHALAGIWASMRSPHCHLICFQSTSLWWTCESTQFDTSVVAHFSSLFEWWLLFQLLTILELCQISAKQQDNIHPKGSVQESRNNSVYVSPIYIQAVFPLSSSPTLLAENLVIWSISPLV